MSKGEVLIIDDEVQIRKLLHITLESNDYKVVEAGTGKEGLALAAQRHPDLILLDIGLPDESGQTILQKLREWFGKPIIVVSVQNDESEIVRALDNGANDYLVKPFRTGELLARMRSSLREATKDHEVVVFEFEDLFIDFVSRILKVQGVPVKLTSTEYSLLIMLVKNEGKVLTHHYLLRSIWGPGYIDQSQYLRVFIAQLRKKIEKDPNRPHYIQTESGVGYRFVASG
jgi:two-component system KDP operon response regulator KdpE